MRSLLTWPFQTARNAPQNPRKLQTFSLMTIQAITNKDAVWQANVGQTASFCISRFPRLCMVEVNRFSLSVSSSSLKRLSYRSSLRQYEKLFVRQELIHMQPIVFILMGLLQLRFAYQILVIGKKCVEIVDAASDALVER